MRKFGYELTGDDVLLVRETLDDPFRRVIIDWIEVLPGDKIEVQGYYEDNGDDFTRKVGLNGTVVVE